MNVDGLFGISRAQAYLDSIIPHIANKNLKAIVLQLSQVAETIQFSQLPNLSNYPFKYYVFKTYLLPSENWKKNTTFLNGTLCLYPEVDNEPYNISNVTEFKMYVLNERFDEDLFDGCLVELIINSEDGNLSRCEISLRCYEYLLKLPKVYGSGYSGYRVTHMVLFLQVVRMRKCLYDTELLNRMLQEECSYIFWEIQKNDELGFVPRLFDLLLEQIDLCGYEGYLEFLPNVLLEYVLKNQNLHGCFRITGLATTIKRESTMMKYGCNSHSTGLASSVLALYLTAMLRTSNSTKNSEF
ncbi:hypothetical protein FQR65_LT03932 [Abscondita terminalis]|nr:hypothetical protein FQR65_LT03932 [Abscondita terminalis]